MTEGVPLPEIFTRKEIKRLEFEKWRQTKTPDDHTPGELLPHLPVVYTKEGKVLSIAEFIEKRRRRLPPHG